MSWAAFCEAVINSIPAMLFALIVFIVVVVLVIKGKIQFKGKGLTVGEQQKNSNMELERTILRSQIEVSEASAEKIIKMLPESLQNWRGRYISEKCFDVMVRAVALNHIEDTPVYISIKQETIKRLVLQLSDDDFFRSPEAEELLDKEVEKLIKKLVEIRNFYTNKKD